MRSAVYVMPLDSETFRQSQQKIAAAMLAALRRQHRPARGGPMPHHIVCLPANDDDHWAAMLDAELTTHEAEGYTLAALTTRTVAVPQTAGMGGATRYETQLVCVFHRP